MKKKLLKFSCLFFAIIMVLSTFVACNFEDETDETESEVSTVGDENAPVPAKDWGGKEFSVLSVQNAYEPNFEIVGDLDGPRVEPAVFQRNVWIQDAYNVDIVEYGDVNLDSIGTIQSQIEAGDSDFDLVFLYREDMATAIISGYMKDLTKVDYLNLTNEWYNQNTIASMKISGKLFHMVSDFSLVDKARTNVIFFNRDLATENNLPDALQVVREGKWTVEEMLKYAIAEDVNGDGKMDLDDSWGLACGGDEVVSTFWKALGNELVTIQDDGSYTINIVSDHSIESIEKTRTLFNSNISFTGDKFGDWDDSYNVFIGNKCMFRSGCLSTIEDLGADAEFSFTALPYPKFDVEQTRYYTTNDNTYCATFGIPVCAEDASFSGFMIEALSWKSHTTTFPEYYNIVCKVKKSYDAECAEMLDLVFDSLVFDFGLLNSKSVKGLRSTLQKSILENKNVTSTYNSSKSTVENSLANMFAAIESF